MVAVNPSTISFDKDLVSNQVVRVRFARQPSSPSQLLVLIYKEVRVAGKVGSIPDDMQKLFLALSTLHASHPGIMPVLDWGVTPEGYIFIVCPRPAGQPLAHAPLNESRLLLRWAGAQLRYLEALSSEGVPHDGFDSRYDLFVDGAYLAFSFPGAVSLFRTFDVTRDARIVEETANWTLDGAARKALQGMIIEIETRAPLPVRREVVPQFERILSAIESCECTVASAAEELEREKFLHETMLYTEPKIVTAGAEEVTADVEVVEEYGYSFPDESSDAQGDAQASADDDFRFSEVDSFWWEHVPFVRDWMYGATTQHIVRYVALFAIGICVSIIAILFISTREVAKREGPISLEDVGDADQPFVEAKHVIDDLDLPVGSPQFLENTGEDVPLIDRDTGREYRSEVQALLDHEDQIKTLPSGIPDEVSALLAQAKEGSFEDRISASKALPTFCKADYPETVKALVVQSLSVLLRDPDNLVRGFAVHAYSGCLGREAIPELKDLLRREESGVVADATTRALEKLEATPG